MPVQTHEKSPVAKGPKQAHFVELGTPPPLCMRDELKKCVERDNGDGILKDHIRYRIVQVAVSEHRRARHCDQKSGEWNACPFEHGGSGQWLGCQGSGQSPAPPNHRKIET